MVEEIDEDCYHCAESTFDAGPYIPGYCNLHNHNVNAGHHCDKWRRYDPNETTVRQQWGN